MAVPEQVVVRALGVAVAMDARDAETAARLRHQWVRALTTAPAEVSVDTTGLAHLSPEAHDYAMTVRVTLRALEATAGLRLNIHAGAVADQLGNALAVVGASGSGKTTAIRALATRLGYLSDETVSLTTDLVLHPHSKPLSVITDPARPRHKSSVSPDDAGLRRPPSSPVLRRIVLLRRGQGTAGLVPVSTPEAIVEIVPQTSSLVLLDSPLRVLAQAIDRCGGAMALHYTDVGDHLDELVELLTADVPPAGPMIHHRSMVLPTASAGEWSRAPWVDAVQYDDELVVMVAETAHLLGGLGTTMWLALSTPRTMGDLLRVAESEHGRHPEAGTLVTRALAQLALGGMVVAPDLPGAGVRVPPVTSGT